MSRRGFLFQNMLLICFISALILFICFTVGKTFLTAISAEHTLIPADFIFVGMALVNTFFATYSLFFKTDFKPFLILFVVCVVLTFVFKEKIYTGYYTKATGYTLPFALIIYFLAASVPIHYDSGLYHIQALKWIEEYAVVPGLGNLHARLAFNPNLFNLTAGFSFSQFFNQPIYAVNSFFSIVFLYFLLTIFFDKNLNLPISIYIFIFLLCAFSILFIDARVSYPTADLAAGLLPFYLFIRYLIALNAPEQKSKSPFPSELIVVFIILAVYILTIKISSLPILLLPILLLFRFKNTFDKGLLIYAFVITVFIVLPWLTKNYFLSGYLIFPVPSIDIFNPDWKIPIAAVDFERRSIIDWAKIASTNFSEVEKMPITEWFPTWYKNISSTWRIMVALAFTSPILFGLQYYFNKKIRTRNDILIIWLTSFVGTCFWFFTAPDVRFGFPFIITAAFAPILFLGNLFLKLRRINTIIRTTGKKTVRLLLCISPYIFVGLLFVIHFKQFLFLRHDAPEIRFLKPLAPDSQTFYRSKDVEGANKNVEFSNKPIEYEIKRIGNFNLFVPINDDRCYCQPLPCTPYYNVNLILRGETLQEGFRVNKN